MRQDMITISLRSCVLEIDYCFCVIDFYYTDMIKVMENHEIQWLVCQNKKNNSHKKKNDSSNLNSTLSEVGTHGQV